MTKPNAVKIHSRDNVVTMLQDVKKGEEILYDNGGTIKSKMDIEAGFKAAVEKIKKGDNIIKYGEIIGRAVQNIELGEEVHLHNVEGLRGRGDKRESDIN